MARIHYSNYLKQKYVSESSCCTPKYCSTEIHHVFLITGITITLSIIPCHDSGSDDAHPHYDDNGGEPLVDALPHGDHVLHAYGHVDVRGRVRAHAHVGGHVFHLDAHAYVRGYVHEDVHDADDRAYDQKYAHVHRHPQYGCSLHHSHKLYTLFNSF